MSIIAPKASSNEKLEKVRETIQDHNLLQIVRMFKVLADQTRMKVLHALCLERELCVSDIAIVVECSVASASHHLRQLSRLDFTTGRNVGKTVMYSIKNNRLKLIIMLALESS
ncbi:metalloregulator ArsR/SmtB family transcription factor [Paenibacillus qinlingensis]|uniref:DNA-binding transcriptional ArsR family regulator n=1 Tax=Paenibacillus qinlingensis TaxID=1837343 RepID=A0ABU1P2M3_9BACL|nr:metalloregulator ArsR/SmtB family transcription factor [Paenibacillus qinlingensis]MDR6553973.1 DNA-binding transcriptional ArsR family regulator [Paenibacillus qinlingensis]